LKLVLPVQKKFENIDTALLLDTVLQACDEVIRRSHDETSRWFCLAMELVR